MYTRAQIESGEGLFASGAHTMIVQRGNEDVFLTADPSDMPNSPAWHIAGGGRILSDGTTRIEWCDAR